MSRKSYFKVDQTDLDKITMADRLHRQMSGSIRWSLVRAMPVSNAQSALGRCICQRQVPIPWERFPSTTRALMQNQ